MCFCGLEPADVEVSVTIPFIGRVAGRIGRRCAGAGAHIVKALMR